MKELPEITSYVDAMIDEAFSAALLAESQSMPTAPQVRKQARIIQAEGEQLLSFCRGLAERPGSGRRQYLENNCLRMSKSLVRSWKLLCEVLPYRPKEN